MATRFKFTKTSISALPSPTKARATYYDTIVPKLALLVTKAGSKNFYIVKRAGIEMVWIKLGSFPDMPVERAREEAEKKLGEFTADSNPATIRRALRAEPTVAEFFANEYGPRHAEKLPSWRNYLAQFNQYVAPQIGKMKLNAVTREQVARLISDVEKSGKSNSMINKIRNLVSGIYRQAIEWGYAETNPVSGIRGRKEKSRARFIQAAELPRFFQSLAGEENTDIRDYILLSLLTGARRSNVVEMRWENVRLDEGVWHIPRTKNDESQDVTLSPEAIAVLEARKNNESPWVFPGKGKTGHLVEPKAGWKRVLDRDELIQLQEHIRKFGGKFEWPAMLDKPTSFRGRTHEKLSESLARARSVAEKMNIDATQVRMPDLRLHDLRRTFGSWQAKTGASLVVIGKSLNHKSQSTTAIYARLELDPVRESVNAATTAMFQAAGLGPSNN